MFTQLLLKLLHQSFLRFCCVGVANTALAFGLYLLFSGFMSIYAANALSWTLACIFSYFVNRAWTFRAADRGPAAFVRFVVVNLGSLGLGLLVMYIATSLGAGRIMSYACSLPVTTLAGYCAYRFWCFRKC